MSAEPGTPEWLREERKLREQEVRLQNQQSRAQSVGAIVAAIATLAAAYAAWQAGRAVRVSQESITRQMQEARLSAALEALGGGQPAQRIAGLTLLRRNVTERLSQAHSKGATDEDHRDARGLYATSLTIVQNYLRSSKISSTQPGTPAGAGYGVPKLSSEITYVANELRFLLNLKDEVTDLPGAKFGVDLSHVVLYSQAWGGIDFSWISHYSYGLDLRGANLTDSRWGTSYLRHSYLQCARLSGSVFGLRKSDGGFSNASLVEADLRGANLSGATVHADLTNAKLDGANLDGTDFTNANLNGVDLSKAVNFDRAKGLDRAVNYKGPLASAKASYVYEDNVDTCLKNRAYWDLPVKSPVRAKRK
jgi:uncharacterized protein YjbI with pentapeptide repeats